MFVTSSFTVVNLYDFWNNYLRYRPSEAGVEKVGATWGQAQILTALCFR